MTKLKKWSNKSSKITFSDLFRQLNPFNQTYHKYVLKLLCFHYSKQIKNDSDIFFERNTFVDFDTEKFKQSFFKVMNNNYPVEYLTNKFFFFGYEFYIKKGCFIPRTETEYLVEWIRQNKILSHVKNVLELCSGSGAISITMSLLIRNKLKFSAIEKYSTPYKISLKNQKIHNTNINFIKADFFKLKAEFLSKFDLLVINPPYIDIDDKNVATSVAMFEPKQALYAKNNGLYFYEYFFQHYYKELKSCHIVFEFGFEQKQALINVLIKNGVSNYQFIKDMNLNDRILYIYKYE